MGIDFKNERGSNLSDGKFDKDAVSLRQLRNLASILTANTISAVVSGITAGNNITISGSTSAITISLKSDVVTDSGYFTSLSGGTIYSGNTELGVIMQQFVDGNDITRIQPGFNITTGGTGNLPIINTTTDPSFISLSAGTLSGGTIFSGSTELGVIIQSFVTTTPSSGFSGWTASTGVHSIKAVNSSVNLASGQYSFVAGKNNSATTIYSSVLGGKSNLASGLGSFIVGGTGNTVTGPISSILGGKGNSITSAFGATIVGGLSNQISVNGSHANVAGGQLNICRGLSSTVGGGQNNTAYAAKSTVSGGHGNLALVNYSTIAGGLGNKAYGLYSNVGGGYRNRATGKNSNVAGGKSNSATSIYSSVVGGKTNLASGYASFVGGGTGNTASGIYSSVVGGKSNTASAIQSSIINGSGNTLTSTAVNSVILGQSDFTGTNPDTTYMMHASASTLSAKTIYVSTISGMSPVNIADVIIENSTLTANTISASTYYSGSTDLSLLFIQAFNSGVLNINSGTNITTGGTASSPTINVTDSPSFNNLSVSGNILTDITILGNVTVFGTATTLHTSTVSTDDNNIELNTGSGATHTTAIGGGVLVRSGQTSGEHSKIITDTNGYFTVSPGLYSNEFSGTSAQFTSVSGGTIYSGSTGLDTIIRRFGTKIQPGVNITTGGTENLPIVNLIDSPFVNNLNASGNSTLNITTSTSFSGTTGSFNTLWSTTGNIENTTGTTSVFSTSTTSPLIIGGVLSSSTLTLRTTSGTGSQSGSTGSDFIFQNGENGSIELARLRNYYSVESLAATGGDITYSGGYTIHSFTSTGTSTFTPSANLNIEYLVVGGGGGGGGTTERQVDGGGGGGAGGFRTGTTSVIASAYTITVGYGGSSNTSGLSSSISAVVTSLGGGYGATGTTTGGADGLNGGSGGGAEFNGTKGLGTAGQGNNGGQGGSGGGNGGGGAAAVGGNATTTGGTGGNGYPSDISGSMVTYAGGGGGGGFGNGISGGTGGAGGGGTTIKSSGTGVNGSAGAANTGGGGSGAGSSKAASGTAHSGGAGGSGIVIIRYLTPVQTITSVQFGIGIPSPTAVLHLTGGTVSAGTASLKIEPGTLLGTPERGAIESDGINLYNTNNSTVRGTLLNNVPYLSSGATLAMSNLYTRFINYSTTGASTWTMFALAGNTNQEITIHNTSTSVLVLNSNAGGSDFYDLGSVVTFKNILAGETYSFYNYNGNYYIIY